MSIIESWHSAFADQRKGQGGADPQASKQAWLQSMEQSGLAAALKQTQVMQAGIFKANAEPGLLTKPAQTSASRASEAVVDVESLASSRSQSTDKQRQLKTLLMPKQALGEQHGAAAWLVQGKSQITQSLPRLNSQAAMTGGLLMRSVQEWSLKNMVVLRGEHGVELWVRDASLAADTKQQQLLKGLREQMGLLGANLVKVVVNGKAVFSQAKPVNTQAF